MRDNCQEVLKEKTSHKDRKMKTSISILIMALLLIFEFCGCGVLADRTTDIKDIRAETENYLGKECTVKGYVTIVLDIPFTSKVYFKINDGSGELWISTDRGIPPENKQVIVKGIFERAINILNIEIGYQLRLKEIKFLD